MSQKPMTKTQLVANLAEATGSDKVTANRALEALADIVSKEVAAGGAVTLPGLGKFQCRARPERMVRNPATGEQDYVPNEMREAEVNVAICNNLGFGGHNATLLYKKLVQRFLRIIIEKA